MKQKRQNKKTIFFLILSLLFITSCQKAPIFPTPTQQTPNPPTNTISVSPISSTPIVEITQPITETSDYQGEVLAGTSTPFLVFNKADYEKVLKSDKLIMLYFYATWCPLCKVEEEGVRAVFNGLQTDRIIGFRVNFNDPATDADEREMARAFGIAYQHTKVFIQYEERLLKSPETWDKDILLNEINKLLSN